jgi:hypothetical protein
VDVAAAAEQMRAVRAVPAAAADTQQPLAAQDRADKEATEALERADIPAAAAAAAARLLPGQRVRAA